MAERYTPLYRLDAGGMAEVFVAEAESVAGFKKKVAIKRILPGLLKDERFLRMFLDEARLSLYLRHSNIVSVFDIGKSDATYFIVMEFVEGTNLKSLLSFLAERGRRVPIHIAVWMLNQMLVGLGYAHDVPHPERSEELLGIVHRDISPPNVLVSWNGEVKITDFGLAKATTQLESTDAGVVKGKFAYLSPEAARGQEVDRRTDIFAVGILAWEMLTGRRLFLGESDWETVEKVRAAEIPSIRQYNPGVPESLDKVVATALAGDLNQRYATCADFADALLEVLFAMGQRVSARDLSSLLEEMRTERSDPGVKAQLSGAGLIAELLSDEIAKFRSIGEDDESGELVDTLGSQPLTPLPDYDPSAPLSGMAGMAGMEVHPEPDSIPSSAAPIEATPRPPNSAPPGGPSPAPKGSSGGLIAAIIVLLVLGGSAAYWFLVMNP